MFLYKPVRKLTLYLPWKPRTTTLLWPAKSHFKGISNWSQCLKSPGQSNVTMRTQVIVLYCWNKWYYIKHLKANAYASSKNKCEVTSVQVEN